MLQPTVKACGRHVGRGQYDSQSTDGPPILPSTGSGSVAQFGCLGGRHHGKCGFGGSLGRPRPTRHLQFDSGVPARPGRGLKAKSFLFLFLFFSTEGCETPG